ncbi:dihydrofolate reductase family protein [Pseudonocardia sp. C8]|uniref:dihydrofolate reductase family protein n=1 Tax=Pseudonocardia sp. C8 TaxID=2762759 RepID=UPI001642C329|nr:dihydrofolate reductase family protein [Pseudonocardia sp. C8]MBC3192663.1 dihydrofolate reductase family protein [Pseudonocardia sp. C8]
MTASTGRITAGLMTTLDGVADKPETWQAPYFDPGMGAMIGAQLAAADVLLLGRRTYEEFAGYWPHTTPSANPMAERMNTIPKLVASTTLGGTAWQPATVVGEDLGDALRRCTGRGETVQVTGSISLVQWLLHAGLLDELAIMVHPLTVGAGRRLFDGAGPRAFSLHDTRAFASGVVALTYRGAS